MTPLERAMKLATKDLSKTKPTTGNNRKRYPPGMKFGQWTVIGEEVFKKTVSAKPRLRPFVPCRCSCGTEYEVCFYCLRDGRSHRCRKCALAASIAKRKDTIAKKKQRDLRVIGIYT